MQSISNKNNRITNKTPQFHSETFQEHLEGYQLQRQNLQFLEFLQALEDYQQELLATAKRTVIYTSLQIIIIREIKNK